LGRGTGADSVQGVPGESNQNGLPQIENDENDLYKEYLQINPVIDPGELILK
jgi:hypothetical protein